MKNRYILLLFVIAITVAIITIIISFLFSYPNESAEDHAASLISQYIYFPYEVIEVSDQYDNDYIINNTLDMKCYLSDANITASDLIENGWVYGNLPAYLILNQNKGSPILDTRVPFDLDMIRNINEHDYFWYFNDGFRSSLELYKGTSYLFLDYSPIDYTLIVLIPSEKLAYIKERLGIEL